MSQEGVKLSTTLHIDEIALKKGHSNFETIIYTEDEILETMSGKKSADLQTILKSIVGIDRIKQVCIDMCAPFADAIRTTLSQAIIVVDRFHVVKLLNKTLEKLRCQTDRKLKGERISTEKELKRIENEEKQLEKELKILLKEGRLEKNELKERELKEKQEALRFKKAEIKEAWNAASLEAKRFSNIRFLLGKSYKDLQKDERRLVRQYLRFNKEMQKVYWLCQNFRKILFSKKPLTETEASTQLTDWCTKAQKHLGHFVKTLSTWWAEVVNACIYPLNNGRAEGFNNKIKLVKRMGFGFRNPQNFKLRIQAACNP